MDSAQPAALSLEGPATSALLGRLGSANQAFALLQPGEGVGRQPVHVVYGGAHLFRADTAHKIGALALRSLRQQFPDAEALGRVLGLGPLAAAVLARVEQKLAREAVEDFRIDFEDGYGNRSDAEEDGHAVQAARAVAEGLRAVTLPPFLGLRLKPLTDELAPRAVRTLDLFVTALCSATGGALPPGLVVTLPKVQLPEQVAALATVLGRLEERLRLAPGLLKLELMVETPAALIAPDGRVPLRALVAAGNGRCIAAHFGAYDYLSACDLTAAVQSLGHPACDFARQVMQVSLAGSGVRLSDGATNVLPLARHRAAQDGALTPAQEQENAGAIHAASALHYRNVRHALAQGYYCGWDLHPAQLPARYAAIAAFFLEGLAQATARLQNFLAQAAQATRVGEVFDDAATGQGLLNFFLRGLGCGALTAEEGLAAGLTLDELRSRSFAQIVAGRRSQLPR